MLKQIDDRVLLVRVGDLLTQMLPYSAAALLTHLHQTATHHR